MYTSYTHTLDSLSKICQDYHNRIARLEDEKYDLEYIVKGKDFQVHIDIHTQKNIINMPIQYFQPTTKKRNNFNSFFFLKNALSNLSSFFKN